MYIIVFARNNKPHLHLFNDQYVFKNEHFDGKNVDFLLKYYILTGTYNAKIDKFDEKIIQKEWKKRGFSEIEGVYLKNTKIGDEVPL
jgi:hypothetical protein